MRGNEIKDSVVELNSDLKAEKRRLNIVENQIVLERTKLRKSPRI